MKKKLPHSDYKLLQEMQADNMLAFDELYKRYHKRLFQFANSILKSKEDAENIVHEVFIRLWENRYKIEKVRPFLFSVAYNATISQIRKKLQEQKFIDQLKSLPESWEQPVNIDLEYKELKEKTEHIISNLPERQREVYLLSRREGLSYAQIAKKLNISVNTVENHLARALKTLRKDLGKFSVLNILFYYLFI